MLFLAQMQNIDTELCATEKSSASVP
jgi:hypothetical protein